MTTRPDTTPPMPASGEPRPIGAALQERMEQLRKTAEARWPAIPPEEVERRAQLQAAAEQRREAEEKQRRRSGRLAAFEDAIGSRYVAVDFDGYEIYDDGPQASVVRACREFGEQLTKRISRAKAGLVLFGPPGTGKDHLLIALLYQAIRADVSVEWHNGIQLYDDWRKEIGRERGDDFGRSRVYRGEPQTPDVLAISDPLPPFGNLTEYQASRLYQLLDDRYNRELPTWVTLNVKSRDEAQQRLGGAIVDRLTHGSLVLFCNWPSYRQRREE